MKSEYTQEKKKGGDENGKAERFEGPSEDSEEREEEQLGKESHLARRVLIVAGNSLCFLCFLNKSRGGKSTSKKKEGNRMKAKELKKKGLHIGFTGIDGAGKSTQAMLLCGWLNEKGIPNILREGKRDFVAEISSAVARVYGIESGRRYLGEEYYMVALSFDLLRETLFDIKPFTNMGIIVVSARTAFCRLAGGIVRGCQSIELAKEIALFGGIPDLTIWLDTPPETAYQRIIQRRFDSAELEHLKRYRESLAFLLQDYPHIRINGKGTVDAVHTKVRQTVEKELERLRGR